jgi:putative RecB family exonuclease
MRIHGEDKPHFSASQLLCYLQCPLQYYLQYELGVVWEKTPSAVLFGSAIHKGVETINRQLMNSGSDIMKAQVEFATSWKDGTSKEEISWKEDPSELYQKGGQLLELYANEMKDQKPTEVELPFRLPLIDPKTGLFIQERDFVGKIDAIFTDDTIVEIKTTSRSPAQQEIDQNTQITFYSWAYRMLYGKPEKAIKVINLVKTKDPKIVVIETQRSDREHSWLLATTFQVLRAISEKLFYPNPIGGFGCFNCQYQNHCKEDNDENYFLRGCRPDDGRSGERDGDSKRQHAGMAESP